MQNTITAETMIDLFSSFRTSHPNLTDIWITYLGLKKRHCGVNATINSRDIDHGLLTLYNIAAGCKDLKREDIVRILLYDASISV
jgi:hypothetical protein